MLASLIASLNSLRDFFSKSFFLAAFLPTLIFVFVNVLIGFAWSWAVHDWIETEWLKGSTANVVILFTIGFFCLWIWSYVTAALTPAGIRILEGANWPNRLSKAGQIQHTTRFDRINDAIDQAVRIHVGIDTSSEGWRDQLEKANLALKRRDVAAPQETARLLMDLISAKAANKLITLAQVQTLIDTCVNEIRAGKTVGIEKQFEEITLILEYAPERARKEQLRLLHQRNSEFGYREDIAPTRFGNIGHLADAFAERAFGCNLALIWSPLRRAAEKEEKKDDNTAKSLETCKTQLDFFVASFWASLLLALIWALIFAWAGEILGALISAFVGPCICILWYSAAVEQYRSLQGLIISSLNGPLRFQVISDLRFALPVDIGEERDLWRTINLVIGNGDDQNLRYQPPPPKP